MPVGVQRALAALHELMGSGKVPTQRELLAHLRRSTGRGCSMRDTVQALRHHAHAHVAEEQGALRSVLKQARTSCASLDAVSRRRVYVALAGHPWREEGGG